MDSCADDLGTGSGTAPLAFRWLISRAIMPFLMIVWSSSISFLIKQLVLASALQTVVVAESVIHLADQPASGHILLGSQGLYSQPAVVGIAPGTWSARQQRWRPCSRASPSHCWLP